MIVNIPTLGAKFCTDTSSFLYEFMSVWSDVMRTPMYLKLLTSSIGSPSKYNIVGIIVRYLDCCNDVAATIFDFKKTFDTRNSST